MVYIGVYINFAIYICSLVYMSTYLSLWVSSPLLYLPARKVSSSNHFNTISQTTTHYPARLSTQYAIFKECQTFGYFIGPSALSPFVRILQLSLYFLFLHHGTISGALLSNPSIVSLLLLLSPSSFSPSLSLLHSSSSFHLCTSSLPPSLSGPGDVYGGDYNIYR